MQELFLEGELGALEGFQRFCRQAECPGELVEYVTMRCGFPVVGAGPLLGVPAGPGEDLRAQSCDAPSGLHPSEEEEDRNRMTDGPGEDSVEDVDGDQPDRRPLRGQDVGKAPVQGRRTGP